MPPTSAFPPLTFGQDYQQAFYFEKQERAKAGKKRVTYFSDLTLAEPDTVTAASAAAAADG